MANHRRKNITDNNQNTKVCPLRMRYAYPYCLGEECAWWLDVPEDCAFPVMAGVLADSSISKSAWGTGKSNDE